MSPRLQRLLTLFLIAYFILLGGTVYTENNAILRVFHQVFTALLLALWLLDLWRSGRPFPKTPLDWPLVVYLGVRLLAALFALDPRVSMEALWQTLTHVLGFYLLVDLMRRGRQRWVMEGLFLVGGVVATLSGIEITAWYFGLPLLPQFVQGWPQIHGLTIPPTIHKVALALTVSTWVGNFSAVIIPLTAAWAMTARQRDLRRGLWLLCLASTGVLILSGSRGALLGFGAAGGIWLLIWLLQEDTRQHFPAALRPLLNRRILLSLAALIGAASLALIFWVTVRAPRSGDINRIDLWESAIEMTRDHPLLGVGPRQYASALRQYGAPELSRSQDHLLTAHNLPLHTLAETGILGFAALLLLGAMFISGWWYAWQKGTPGRRRRLEGALAALTAFGVHNLVDTFPLTPQLLPILIIMAYTVAGATTRAEALAQREKPTFNRRMPILIALAALLIAQAAFLPVHVAELAHARALRALATKNLPEALAATRAAQQADPWLAFYPIHEAYILGRLAAENPETYLAEAIDAHEQVLALNPTWDRGWQNLGGLYAQAGRYVDAAAALQTAININPVPAGYHLNLGTYYEIVGDAAEAQQAYFDALQRNPDLAGSDFWLAPAHPEHADILDEAIAFFSEEAPTTALRVALITENWEEAETIIQTLDQSRRTQGLLLEMALWAARLGEDPSDYYAEAMRHDSSFSQRDYEYLAELLLLADDRLDTPALTAELAARTALFLSEGRSTRSWYVLARLAEQSEADDEAINTMLARAVPPVTVPLSFGIAVYRRIATFDELPQARTPRLARYQYAPWIQLAEQYESTGQIERARRVYEALLLVDPYAERFRERLEVSSGN